ncbi:MAG: DUF4271 domain-containing protein [Prevotella sp.]|nr:DUF4271 domain-containing protein [Prevotella sp.]
MNSQDSLSTALHGTAYWPGSDSAAARPQRHELTPREVLSWLPKNATPAQQDSAIQRHIKISEIHWSEQPDTLHMPGHSKGKSFRDISLPKYYRESFFSKSSLFHPELSGGRQGVAGDPVPYTIAGDNVITSILLACFIIVGLSFGLLRQLFKRQLKDFFRPKAESSSGVTETFNEVRLQIFLAFQTSLLFGICYFFYINSTKESTFVLEQYQMIGIYAITFLAYFLGKSLLYAIASWIFVGGKKIIQWQKTNLFLIALEGLLMFPLILVVSFFGVSIQNSAIYTVIVIILTKILVFFKSRNIFFKQTGGFLQLFLYLCALEIMPLLNLWGTLTLISSYLKINF